MSITPLVFGYQVAERLLVADDVDLERLLGLDLDCWPEAGAVEDVAAGGEFHAVGFTAGDDAPDFCDGRRGERTQPFLKSFLRLGEAQRRHPAMHPAARLVEHRPLHTSPT